MPGSSRPPIGTPAWAGRLASGFVLLALVALVAVPAAIQRRLAPSRAEAASADEARTLVTRVQFSLARQMSLLQTALLTPDTALPRLYMEALELERSSYPELDSLVAPLSAPAAAALGRLERLSSGWHLGLDEATVFRGGTEIRAEILRRDLSRYEGALDAARELDAALAAAARARRERIARDTSRQTLLTGGMVLIAFLSAVAVSWFAHRVRTLAAESGVRRMEAESALAELRRLSESRTRLMRGITHDLKNPLGAADGYGQLLELGVEGELSSGHARMVAGMRRSISAALGMIAGLLDFSRADSGELSIALGPTNCGTMLREAIEQFGGSARAAGHVLELRLREEPIVVRTDPERACEVIGNLLSNAIKYTPAPGRIVVTEAVRDRPGVAGVTRWVAVTVADSGPGIPLGERDRIFDEFHRLHDGEAAGHGLGLATSRRVVDALGGSLTVGDADEGGAAFTFWLPVDE